MPIYRCCVRIKAGNKKAVKILFEGMTKGIKNLELEEIEEIKEEKKEEREK